MVSITAFFFVTHFNCYNFGRTLRGLVGLDKASALRGCEVAERSLVHIIINERLVTAPVNAPWLANNTSPICFIWHFTRLVRLVRRRNGTACLCDRPASMQTSPMTTRSLPHLSPPHALRWAFRYTSNPTHRSIQLQRLSVKLFAFTPFCTSFPLAFVCLLAHVGVFVSRGVGVCIFRSVSPRKRSPLCGSCLDAPPLLPTNRTPSALQIHL
jgi:hypothetical protein